MSEEKPEPDNASEKDRNGQPGAIEKFVQGPAIRCDHALDEIAGPFFHACTFMPGFAFAQNARAHQRSEC